MNDVLSLLGLCLRAGKLVYGDDAVADTVAAGDVRLLVLAADAGANISRRAARHTETAGVPVLRITEDAAQMGWAIGRRATAICCITDIGFAASAAQKAAEADAQYAALAQQLSEKKTRIQSRRGRKKPRRKSAGGQSTGGVNQSTHTKRGGERA